MPGFMRILASSIHVPAPFPIIGRRAGVALLLLAVGCGSGATNVSLDSLESGSVDLAGKSLDIRMLDGMRMKFYAEKVEYPYLWGQRFVGERMPLREMRIDLREVKNVTIIDSG